MPRAMKPGYGRHIVWELPRWMRTWNDVLLTCDGPSCDPYLALSLTPTRDALQNSFYDSGRSIAIDSYLLPLFLCGFNPPGWYR